MLNPTDEKFVAAIVRGLNQTEAAIAAGLSEKSAQAAGARLRKKKSVVDALAAIGFSTPGAPITIPTAKPDALEDEVESEELNLPSTTDSLEFLEAVQAHPKIPLGRRMEAAKTLLPFQHAKIGEKGKKATKAEGAANAAAEGNKFGARAAPAALKAVK